MRWLASILEEVCCGCRRDPPPVSATLPDGSDDDYRFERLRESYEEVLAATKHEDDKVGRFLAAIAFLVAGALIFAQQADILQMTYDLGVQLALPALSLVAFLFVVTLAVLQYVLAIAAPVTIPPGSSDEVKHSHLFFLLIAQETKKTWARKWEVDAQTLRQELMDEYQNEILNLGQRAHNKRRRSEEASALFAVALLFFGLTVGFSIDVISKGGGHEWSLSVRLGVAAWLTAFAALMLYQRYRVRAVGRIEIRSDERLKGFGRMTLGLAATIAVLLLPGQIVAQEVRGVLAVVVVAAAVIAVRGLFAVLPGGERTSAGRVVPVVWGLLAVLFTLAAPAAVWFTLPGWQLLLALAAAVSPLAGQVTTAVGETTSLRRNRRNRAAELK